MIKDAKLPAEFEDNELRKEKPNYRSALRLFEARWREGMLLGVLPLKDPLEGIEVDIKIAGILNDVRATHYRKSDLPLDDLLSRVDHQIIECHDN